MPRTYQFVAALRFRDPIINQASLVKNPEIGQVKFSQFQP